MEKPKFPLGHERVSACLLMDEEKGYALTVKAQVAVLFAINEGRKSDSGVISIADVMDKAWDLYPPQDIIESMQLSFLCGMYYFGLTNSDQTSASLLMSIFIAAAGEKEGHIYEGMPIDKNIPDEDFVRLATMMFEHLSKDALVEGEKSKFVNGVLDSILNNKNDEDEEEQSLD